MVQGLLKILSLNLLIKRATAMHNMISAKHRRDTTMVALLFSIVLIFLLCHSIRLGLNIYEAFQVRSGEKVGLTFLTALTRC